MSYTPGPLPAYLYGRECGQHERVWIEQSVKEYAAREVARAVAAERERLALTDELVERAYKEIWRDLPSDFDYTAHAWIEQGMRYVAALVDPQRLQGKGE